MSSAFERLQKVAEDKKNAKLELVQTSGLPPADDAVNHKSPPAVNPESDKLFTTDKNSVNNTTAAEENVNLLTAEKPFGGKQKDLFTAKQKSVNHKERDWTTTDRKRGAYGEAVESFRTSEDFKKKIKVFCAENKIDKQDFYRIVVNHYFETAVNREREDAVNNLTYDDRRLKTLYKTKPAIINLYLAVNSIFNPKSKWTIRDDDAGLRFNDVDIRIVELGILQTLSNKNFSGKINSFNYYIPEIENLLEIEISGETLNVMLQINRKRFEQITGKSVDLSFLDESQPK